MNRARPKSELSDLEKKASQTQFIARNSARGLE